MWEEGGTEYQTLVLAVWLPYTEPAPISPQKIWHTIDGVLVAPAEAVRDIQCAYISKIILFAKAWEVSS